MTTTREQTLSPLRQSLAEFVRLLENEAQALENLQTEDMASLLATKAACADTVSRAWSELIQSVAADAAHAQDIRAAVCQDAEGAAEWEQIAHLARAAASLNQSNGTLIDAQLRRTRQAVDILQKAATKNPLYGEHGQMLDTLTSHRTLDKA